MLEFRPKIVSIADEKAYKRIKKQAPPGTKLIAGRDGAVELMESLDMDVAVTAMVGAVGLLPTLCAIRKGIRVGIANKEPLVTAGKIMVAAAKRHSATIIPIDSEHSALWQCLNGEPVKRVKKL